VDGLSEGPEAFPPDPSFSADEPVSTADGVVGVEGGAGAGFGPFEGPGCAGVRFCGFCGAGVGSTGAASGKGAGRSWISGTRVRAGALRSTTALMVSAARTSEATIANLKRLVSCTPP
jgi:hypothetical protein